MGISSERRRRRAAPIEGLADAQRPTTQFHAIELVDGLPGGARISELHEREATGPRRHPIHWQHDLDDRSDGREQGLELVLGGLEAQVTDENA